MNNNQANIKIYTSINCPFSKRLKEFLYEKVFPFEEIDISNDKKMIEECFEISGVITTPVIVVKYSSDRSLVFNGWNQENKFLIMDLLNS